MRHTQVTAALLFSWVLTLNTLLFPINTDYSTRFSSVPQLIYSSTSVTFITTRFPVYDLQLKKSPSESAHPVTSYFGYLESVIKSARYSIQYNNVVSLILKENAVRYAHHLQFLPQKKIDSSPGDDNLISIV